MRGGEGGGVNLTHNSYVISFTISVGGKSCNDLSWFGDEQWTTDHDEIAKISIYIIILGFFSVIKMRTGNLILW